MACRIFHVPCIGRWILNHWTTREVPVGFFFFQLKCSWLTALCWEFCFTWWPYRGRQPGMGASQPCRTVHAWCTHVDASSWAAVLHFVSWLALVLQYPVVFRSAAFPGPALQLRCPLTATVIPWASPGARTHHKRPQENCVSWMNHSLHIPLKIRELGEVSSLSQSVCQWWAHRKGYTAWNFPDSLGLK